MDLTLQNAQGRIAMMKV